MRDATPKTPTLQEIRAAAMRLAPHITRTPLLRLNNYEGKSEIFLKLENLQPVGVFKVRSMGNALMTAKESVLGHGAYTASTGNAGLGLAWAANRLGIRAAHRSNLEYADRLEVFEHE